MPASDRSRPLRHTQTRDLERRSRGGQPWSRQSRELADLHLADPDDAGTHQPERLTWNITSTGAGTVMLQLIHDGLTEEHHARVGAGWAAVPSRRRTLLETEKVVLCAPQG